MKKNTKVALFTDKVFEYFDEVIEGVCSPMAYYELFEKTDSYFRKATKDYKEYLEFTFGIEEKDFKKIKENYNKSLKELEKII